MTKQEKEKLNKVIEYIENLKSYCLQEYENAADGETKVYYKGAYCNIYPCLNEIKEKFNIKD